MLNFIPIVFATTMAALDSVVLSWLKYYSLGKISWIYIPLGMIVYSLQPLLFVESLKYETLTVMNILWDVISDILVSGIGLFYFKEKISTLKMIGLSFSCIAVILLSYDELDTTN